MEQRPSTQLGNLLPSQFIPFREGFVRNLSLDSPHFTSVRNHIEILIDYKFNRAELLLESTYPLKKEPAWIGNAIVIREGNYRLAVFGDALLKMAILDARYDLAELTGTTDLIVQRLVSDQNLANIADALGITPHLAIWYQKGVEVSKRAKATTIEAIIGAVWFDSGKDLDAVKKILPALLGEELDAQKTDR